VPASSGYYGHYYPAAKSFKRTAIQGALYGEVGLEMRYLWAAYSSVGETVAGSGLDRPPADVGTVERRLCIAAEEQKVKSLEREITGGRAAGAAMTAPPPVTRQSVTERFDRRLKRTTHLNGERRHLRVADRRRVTSTQNRAVDEPVAQRCERLGDTFDVFTTERTP